jgi:integrase
MPRPRGDNRPTRPTVRRRLTDRMIRGLVPELGRADRVYDELQRGLSVFIQPSGRKSFVVIYRCAGRPRWHKIGDASIGIAAARKIAQRVAFEVASGRDPQGERVSDRAAGSFAELHRLYVDGHAKRFNKSWRQAAKLIENHVLPHLGRAKAAAVSRTDVKTIMARLADRPPLANAVLVSISAVFSWAVAEEVGGVTSNPCARIRRNETRARERVLSDSEVKLLWPEFDPTLRLLLLTGQRMNEVINMRAEDIRDGVWNLPGEAIGSWPGVKNGCSHRVPLSATAAGLVDAHLADRSRRRSKSLLARLVAKHGLPRLTPHDLRRSFGTLVARLGFGRAAMDRLLNHADRSIASVYDRHGYEAEDRRIVDAVARHVVAVAEGRAEDNVVVRLR